MESTDGERQRQRKKGKDGCEKLVEKREEQDGKNDVLLLLHLQFVTTKYT